MEYIQTVLFQIEASRLEQAAEPGRPPRRTGRAPRLSPKQQPGSATSASPARSTPRATSSFVVETRWADDASLVRYETNEPNVAAIVTKHRDVIAPDSLQVLDMEALRTESSCARREAAAAHRTARASADPHARSASWPSRCSSSTASRASTWRSGRRRRRAGGGVLAIGVADRRLSTSRATATARLADRRRHAPVRRR